MKLTIEVEATTYGEALLAITRALATNPIDEAIEIGPEDGGSIYATETGKVIGSWAAGDIITTLAVEFTNDPPRKPHGQPYLPSSVPSQFNEYDEEIIEELMDKRSFTRADAEAWVIAQRG